MPRRQWPQAVHTQPACHKPWLSFGHTLSESRSACPNLGHRASELRPLASLSLRPPCPCLPCHALLPRWHRPCVVWRAVLQSAPLGRPGDAPEDATPRTQETARAALGPLWERAAWLLDCGFSVRAAARHLGVDARLLSTARGGPPESLSAPSSPSPAPQEETRQHTRSRAPLARYRRLLDRRLPLPESADLLVGLARGKNPAVAERALARIDELRGLVAPKVATDPHPPPLFALEADVRPAMRVPTTEDVPTYPPQEDPGHGVLADPNLGAPPASAETPDPPSGATPLL